MLTLTCEHCGTAFQSYASNRRRFCSAACGNIVRRAKAGALTANRVNELFTYDASSGALTRKVSVGHQAAGSIVGSPKGNGYLQIVIDRRNHLAHRVIWLLVTGSPPQHEIDHINGDRGDNRFVNFRDVPSRINSQNIRTATGAVGLMGVSKYRKRFRAQISINNACQYLGTFDTPEEAHAIYLETKRRVHPGCTL